MPESLASLRLFASQLVAQMKIGKEDATLS